MDLAAITADLHQRAAALGFTLRGIAPAVAAPGFGRLQEWLAAGYAGEMGYLAEREAAYAHPEGVLAGVRSVVMLAMPYRTDEPRPPEPGQGRVARYAWGPGDYHDVVHERLKELAAWVRTVAPEAKVRGVVDTAPLLEREFAQLAGLGWVGKHTLLIHKPAGSYFFLAALLTDLDLPPDVPFTADHCGTCRACLDACPTAAFPQPYVLDATRCISYLTIELRGPIPRDLRPGLGEWLFGCDVCQDVCPWNSRSPQTAEPEFQPAAANNPIDAVELLGLDEAAFRERFRWTPLWRAKRRGILRNAAIVLGNRPTPRGLAALIAGLSDAEPLVRGACAWALGRYAEPAAREALQARAEIEEDETVREELQQALQA